MNSRTYDVRLSFERATKTTNSYGDEVSNWAPISNPWANVSYGKGEERRDAAQENATVAATFRVRRNAISDAVSTTDRIVFDGGAWDITSNVPAPGRAERDITAIRSAP